MAFKRLMDINDVKEGMIIAVVDNVNEQGSYQYTTGELYEIERIHQGPRTGTIKRLSMKDPIIQVLDISGRILLDDRISESAHIYLIHAPFIMVFEVVPDEN